MSDLETVLRSTLNEAERTAPAPHDLAERLIANTLTPRRGAPHVVTLHGRRAARRWLPPLLVAALIIAIVTAGLIVRVSLSSDRPANKHSKPPPPQVQSPTNFFSTDVYFSDADHGWAIGDGCEPGRSGCLTILYTSDGARTWRAIPAPPVGLSATECRQTGDESAGPNPKPCVSLVVFADEENGYAWGYRTFFWTNNGGRTWQRDSSYPLAVQVVGRNVLRVVTSGKQVGPAVLQVAKVGTANWRTVSPDSGSSAEISTITSRGNVAYYLATKFPSFRSALYRSADAGETWTKVNAAPCGTRETLAVDPAVDGSLAATCYGGANATIRISTDGGRTFGADVIAPGTRKTTQSQLAPELLPVSSKVWLERVNDRQPTAGWNYRRTTDGGRTWQLIDQDVAIMDPFSWTMFDAKNGYRSNYDPRPTSDAAVLFTHDGGKTWVRVGNFTR